ncbi:MAG: hypothetical protein KGH72_00190 [Candidatus Micrarchaeota archaeon]|nr:hypothetical protein [Candidatus Micrarchaeota archaeon]
MERDKPEKEKAEKKEAEDLGAVSLYEPMFFWLLLLFLGLVVKIVLVNQNSLQQVPPLYYLLSAYSKFVLSTPGFIVLPLIAGAIIGAEVGVRAKNMRIAVRSSILHSAYAAAIYFVAIIVVYEVVNYSFPSTVLSLGTIIAGWIFAPVIIVLFVSVVFAMLSNARKMNQ